MSLSSIDVHDDFQGDLFSTNFQRPEDDPYVGEIVERFGGRLVAIRDFKDGPATWLETIRPPAQRRRYAVAGHGGVPVAERLDETVTVHNRSKNKNGLAIHPWRLVWSESRLPLLVGLFESERLAADYRRGRR